MFDRRPSLLSGFVAIVMLVSVTAAIAQTAPQLTSAVSRKNHTGVNFDIALPLAGASGIECRDVSNAAGGMTVVLLFDQPVSAGNITITGTASAAAPSFSGNAITINLTGVANAQELTIAADSVTNGGGPAGAGTVKARALLGDVDASGDVNSTDVSKATAQVGFPVTGANFRNDINESNTISGADVNTVNASVGTNVAGGAAANTAPTVSDITNQSVESGASTNPIAFTVGDAESDPASLALTATSSNQSLVANTGIIFGGTGAARTVKLTSTAGQTGTATITVTASDGLATGSDSFDVTVTPPTRLYIAYMRPQGSTLSQGSGSSTLRLAGDELSASVKYSYANLSSPFSAAHVHGPADPVANTSAGILFDLDVQQQDDGSYLWTFPSDPTQRQQLVDWIKQGKDYINVHTTNYPNGEIKGFYALASGSQTFTPPPPVPTIDPGIPTDTDASRFLTQATFGATYEEITRIKKMRLDAWVNEQFNQPATRLLPILQIRQANRETITASQLWDAWWQTSLRGGDQLRQRVAFALSQILVVSQNHAVLTNQPMAVANYYDLLLNDCFGNFRDLIEHVTLNPAMGTYLDMRGNVKANLSTGTNPNENYAREIMQLFSVGLNKVHPDGTLQLDEFGLPIPTYDQNVVVGFARVFTGWNWHQEGFTILTSPPADYINPMTMIPANHENRVMTGQTYSKLLLDGVTLAPNRTGEQDLKDALDTIFNHPNVGPFICRELIQRLVTSNPSPGYVYRVAQVFANNGSGVRGDMKAVIKAILFDYEARSSTFLNTPGYGKLKEPVLRTTQLVRAFHPTSTSGYWRMGNTDASLSETPLRSPTVFNFFEPDYARPGEIAEAGLVSPEFQITGEITAISASNAIRDGIYNGFVSSTNRDIKLTFSPEQSMAAANVSGMLDRMSLILMGNAMTSDMKNRIQTEVQTVSSTDTLGRARAAAHLITTSADFSVQR